MGNRKIIAAVLAIGVIAGVLLYLVWRGRKTGIPGSQGPAERPPGKRL